MTLNVRGEAPVLGYIVGDTEGEDGSENTPRCVLTELGKKVEEVWNTVDANSIIYIYDIKTGTITKGAEVEGTHFFDMIRVVKN